MGAITNLEHWAGSRRKRWFSVFRIILGVFIVIKGYQFLADADFAQHMGINMQFLSLSIAHIVIPTHLIGGALIALGIFTRLMCLIQIPILLGAIVLVNYEHGFLSLANGMELELSIVVLLGLIFFTIFGAGKYSIDEIRRRDDVARSQPS